MNRREFEFIPHNIITDVQMMFVDITFRNMHMHKEFELFCVFSGEMDMISQNASHRLCEGDFALINPRCAHEICTLGAKPVRIMPLQISPGFWSRFFPQMSNVEFDVIAIDKCLGDRKAELMNHYIAIARAFLEKEPYYELHCAARINTLMEILLSCVPWHYLTETQKATKRAMNLRLGRIINHIEANFTDKLLLNDLCEMEGLTLHYLSRYFKAHFGMSFQEYLTMLRYGRARLLLERTDLKPGDIAYSSGFSDIRYMNHIFQKMHGCDPLSYREFFLQGKPIQRRSPDGEDVVQRFLDESESRDYLRCWLKVHSQRVV